MSRSPSPAQSLSKSAAVDRQKTTPFLLNFCYRSSAFHNLADFPVPTASDPSPPLPAHLQIYTWYSCTLRELAHLLTSTLPNIVPDPAIGTRLSFRLVFPDTSPGAAGGSAGHRLGRLDEGRPRYMSKEMGSVVVSASRSYANGHGNEDDDMNGGRRQSQSVPYELGGDDADKTLADVKFVIGDYIDCAVFPPLSDGSVVPRGSVSGRGGGGYRENGYSRPRGGGGGYGPSRGGGFGGGRGDFGGNIPSGEWRRGERLPESGGYRGGGGGGYRGGRGGRRDPY